MKTLLYYTYFGIRDVLDILILEEIDAVEENLAGDDILRLIETLDQVAEVSDGYT
jgi:hypothetical protein